MSCLPETLFDLPPFSLRKPQKAALMREVLGRLTRHHATACVDYQKILAAFGFNATVDHDPADIPFIPARYFKMRDLKSVPDLAVKKVLTSSGTSGQSPSRIFLDAETATLQGKVLSRIVADFIGSQRLPMLVLDSPLTVKAGASHSARAAGILGFSLFGKDVTYALTDDMHLDLKGIERFLDRHAQEKILLFGFTFIVYLHFIQALELQGIKLDLRDGILIHGGGWKKLAEHALDDVVFQERLRSVSGITRTHNYYGTVEQAGSIFMACAQGNLHASNYADIIVRGDSFQPLGFGSRGLVELVSLVPHSYPGHKVLTEDEGTILGEDDCPCGRCGKYFRIHGRAAEAEARGCSDTYDAKR